MLGSVVVRVVCGITEVDRAEVGATGVVGVWVPCRALRSAVMSGLWGAEVDVGECVMKDISSMVLGLRWCVVGVLGSTVLGSAITRLVCGY